MLSCLLQAAWGAAPDAKPLFPAVSGIVDIHCHAAGIGSGGSGCYVSPRMASSFKFRFYLEGFGVTRADLVARGDSIVIDRISEGVAASHCVGRAVILAIDSAIDEDGREDLARTELYVPDRFVAAEVAKHRNLLFGASVNPLRKDAVERLAWDRDHGAVLVKWLPSIQGFDPADPRCEPFYRKLAELHLPLLCHTGIEHSFTREDQAMGDPERLRPALKLGVTVIAAHGAAGGSYFGMRGIDRLAAMMGEFPNLYADISAMTLVNRGRHFAELVQRPEFRGRLLFGTDYPLVAIRALVSPWYFPVRLPLARIREIDALGNPWDRDVALKLSLIHI